MRDTASADVPRPRASGPRVLLVGGQNDALLTALSPLGPLDIERADTFVEALLLCGGQTTPFNLIVGTVEEESLHLRRALETLRLENPSARIIVLCESHDEPMCRRALHWGADDYLVLPLGAGQLTRVSGLKAPAAAGNDFLGDFSPAGAHPDLGQDEQPDEPRDANSALTLEVAPLQAPLVVQAALLQDVLQNREQSAEKALNLLRRHLRLGAEVRFLPTADYNTLLRDAGNGFFAAPVEFDGITYGGVQLLSDAPTAAMSAQLDQLAAFMGIWAAAVKRYDQLRIMAITDELSGAYNRRYFTQWMQTLLERAREGRFRVTILLFDIDNFKSYNDRFGHAAGDVIIRETIGLLRHCTRANDLVARIGGDEFAVVFWDSEAPRQPNSQHPRNVLTVTERFRKAVAGHEWSRVASIQGNVSISGGLATFPWDGEELETLMLVADGALMQAKNSGKNAIVLSPTIQQSQRDEASAAAGPGGADK